MFLLSHLGELLSELVQFLLQRRLLLLSGGHLVTNLTDLSGDASCNSNTSGFTSCNVGALNRDFRQVSSSVWTKLNEISRLLGLTRHFEQKLMDPRGWITPSLF